MADAVIDLDAIQAELGAMSEEDLRKTLLDMKVKEKVTTKKYYNPETAKKARQKMAATKKAIIELAKAKGFYDEINATADAAVKAAYNKDSSAADIRTDALTLAQEKLADEAATSHDEDDEV